MQIAVCDDNKQFLEGFVSQIENSGIVDNIAAFSDWNAFLFSIDEGKQYDAVFMDIDWQQSQNGIDFAEELYKLSPSTKIIYVTGYGDRYSQHIFLHEANLSGFLTKPVDMSLLYANLNKIANGLTQEGQPVLVLRQRGLPVSISIREICFIESRGHTIEVHTVDEIVAAYEKLQTVLRMLPAGFFQCHKSYVVNMNQIRRFQSTDILLKNGKTVPVSRARYAATKEAYFSYIGQSF